MSESKPNRPVPKPNTYLPTQPFWDAAKQGKLVLQRCTETGKFQHPPRPVSVYTGRRTLEWHEVSGNGTIYGHTVVRIASPDLEGRIPLCCATVELDEGVRIIGNVLGCAPEDLQIGRRVRLAWDKLNDDVNYPAFRLV